MRNAFRYDPAQLLEEKRRDTNPEKEAIRRFIKENPTSGADKGAIIVKIRPTVVKRLSRDN
ncbi:hypothetical protein JW758_01650 [Candidatus Peregrinibacteria bacterium]|nr:hypothetical protein [Candidatus Peregrinibacteria bacterium]